MKEIWWAVAPGVGGIAFAVAILVSLLIPENNGWASVLILGVAAFLIAAIPNVRDSIKVAYSMRTTSS
jgi:UDP-N-acetylmuramyl pentapeptide phosphotransferase/UDP-N-acetylglucosamine-1-phosphate transferase